MATLNLIDVCLGCYLTDHHNRPGELLLGVPVDNSTTYEQLREELRDCFRQIGYDMTDEGKVTSADFEAALVNCFANVQSLEAPFDPSLEPIADDDGDYCQAWFLLEY